MLLHIQTYVFAHAYNKQTPQFRLTLLPTFVIFKLLKGHASLSNNSTEKH